MLLSIHDRKTTASHVSIHCFFFQPWRPLLGPDATHWSSFALLSLKRCYLAHTVQPESVLYVLYENVIVKIMVPQWIPILRYRLSPTLATTTAPHRHLSSPEPRAQRALCLAAASLYRRTATTLEPTKEKATIRMYDCSDSDRKVSATKKIHSRSTKKRVVYFTKSDSELESDEDVNEASMKRNFKKTANTEPALLYLPGTSESARLYISPALPSRMGKKGKVTEKAAPAKKNQFLTSFVELRKTATKIPTTSDEDTASVSFLSDEDVATVSGPSTPNWNRVKAKESPEVFEAVVNDDDLKLPARHTVLPPPPCLCLNMQRRRRKMRRTRRLRRGSHSSNRGGKKPEDEGICQHVLH